jgi:hypothetical protein
MNSRSAERRDSRPRLALHAHFCACHPTQINVSAVRRWHLADYLHDKLGEAAARWLR